ncbi:hypothetical protein GCM10010524_04130 [Streptomyces mexicanus]
MPALSAVQFAQYVTGLYAERDQGDGYRAGIDRKGGTPVAASQASTSTVRPVTVSGLLKIVSQPVALK